MKKKLIIVLSIIAIFAISFTAWAQTTEPGPNTILSGRIFTDFGYQNLSKENTTNNQDDVTTAFLQVTSSYLRGSWTSADKTTGGLVELGASAKGGDSEVVGLRFAYGWWKIGNCQIVAGQTDGWLGSSAYGPRQELASTLSAKNQLRNFGFIYSGRSPQVRFEWQSGEIGFSIAAVQPAAEQIPAISDSDIYANFPRFDIAAEFKAGNFISTPGFGWSKLEYQIASGQDNNFNSWIAVLPIKYVIGPFTAKFQAHTGINTEVEWLGEANSAMRNAPKILPMFSEKEYDSKEIGGVIALEYQMTALTATVGYGMVTIENDFWKTSNGYQNDDYTRSAWFIALPYSITKNFSIQPEFTCYMFGDKPATGKEMGIERVGGIQLRFTF